MDILKCTSTQKILTGSPIDNLMKNGSVVFIGLSILVDQNIG